MAENRRPPMPSLITTLGGTIAAVYSRCQSQRNYEFAMDTCNQQRGLPMPAERLSMREGLWLRHALSLSYREISEALGIGKTAAGEIVRRAVQQEDERCSSNSMRQISSRP